MPSEELAAAPAAPEAEDPPVNGFDEIKAEVEAGQTPRRRLRDLLAWFGAKKRGAYIVERIGDALQEAGIETEPDFRTAWFHGDVIFKKAAATPVADQDNDPDDDDVATEEVAWADGPEYVVGMLDSANCDVIVVGPQDEIEKAITLMMMHDFSQLAVMTNERDLKGAISWKSIGRRLSQNAGLKAVKDAIEPAVAIADTASLFDATRVIIEKEFVFVRAKDQKIAGIVTASDLSEQFHALSEPFLILSRIEAHIRRLIRSAFDTDTLRSVVDEKDTDRKANLTSAAQLTFGEYQRLFEQPDNWAKLDLVACRKTFCDALGEVRQLRNEIMHFHPDALEGGDHEPLKRFLTLLETLDGVKT